MFVIDWRIKPPLRTSDQDKEVELVADFAPYDPLYSHQALMDLTLGDLLQDLEAHAIQPSVLQSEHSEHAWGSHAQWNDHVHEILTSHPGSFVCGFGGVDPRDPMSAVREVERCYHELGFRGISFEPSFLGISPLDRRCYPVYAKCVELGIPIGLHTGVNFSLSGRLRFELPIMLDEIASDFRELVLVAHHGGWPWVGETMAVAWKHPNVYIELGAIAPKYVAANGGWGDLPHFMNTLLKHKVLFGTDWPMLRYGRVLEEIDLIGLDADVLLAYTQKNAERLLDRALS
jgi:uncharacterized protein